MKISIPAPLIKTLCVVFPLLMWHPSGQNPGLVKPGIAMWTILAGNGLTALLALDTRHRWKLYRLVTLSHFLSLAIASIIFIPLTVFPVWDTSRAILAFKLTSLMIGIMAAMKAGSLRINARAHDLAWIIPAIIVFQLISINGSYHDSGDCWVHMAAARRILEGTYCHGVDSMVNHPGVDVRYSWSMTPALLSVLSHISVQSPLESWINLGPSLCVFSPPAFFFLAMALTGSIKAASLSGICASLLLLRSGSWAPEGSLLSLPSAWSLYVGVPGAIALAAMSSRGRELRFFPAAATFCVTVTHLFYGIVLSGIIILGSAFQAFSPGRCFRPALFTGLFIASVISPLVALRASDTNAVNPFFLYFPGNNAHQSYDSITHFFGASIIDPRHSLFSAGMSASSILPAIAILLALFLIRQLRKLPGSAFLFSSVVIPIIVMHMPLISEMAMHTVTVMKVARMYQFIPVIALSSALVCLISKMVMNRTAPNGNRLAKLAFYGLSLSMFLSMAPLPEHFRQLRPRQTLSNLLHTEVFLELAESLMSQPPGVVLASSELSLLIPGLTHHRVYSIPEPHYSPSVADAISRGMLYPFITRTEYARGLKKLLNKEGISLVILPVKSGTDFLREELNQIWSGKHFIIMTPRRIAESGRRV